MVVEVHGGRVSGSRQRGTGGAGVVICYPVIWIKNKDNDKNPIYLGEQLKTRVHYLCNILADVNAIMISPISQFFYSHLNILLSSSMICVKPS